VLTASKWRIIKRINNMLMINLAVSLVETEISAGWSRDVQ